MNLFPLTMRSFRCAALLISGSALIGCASTGSSTGNSAFSVILENDLITSSDNNYTNGIGLSWSTDEVTPDVSNNLVSEWIDFWSFLPVVGDTDARTYASWTLGQEVHTPDDITNPNPPLDDQPYAGVLFLDNVLYARRERWQHAWSLRLGIVGPSSQAENVQTGIHDYLGGDEPRGWNAQLADEPVINVGYTAGYVWRRGDLGESMSWRVAPLMSADLGTYITAFGGGVVGEFGWNLAEALGVGGLRYRLNSAPTIGAGPQEAWTLSVFGGVGGGGIAHYLPLDGTVFRNSRSVDSNPFVGIVTAGVSLRHQRLALSISTTFFTERFDTERQRADFGTVAFAWYF